MLVPVAGSSHAPLVRQQPLVDVAGPPAVLRGRLRILPDGLLPASRGADHVVLLDLLFLLHDFPARHAALLVQHLDLLHPRAHGEVALLGNGVGFVAHAVELLVLAHLLARAGLHDLLGRGGLGELHLELVFFHVRFGEGLDGVARFDLIVVEPRREFFVVFMRMAVVCVVFECHSCFLAAQLEFLGDRENLGSFVGIIVVDVKLCSRRAGIIHLDFFDFAIEIIRGGQGGSGGSGFSRAPLALHFHFLSFAAGLLAALFEDILIQLEKRLLEEHGSFLSKLFVSLLLCLLFIATAQKVGIRLVGASAGLFLGDLFHFLCCVGMSVSFGGFDRSPEPRGNNIPALQVLVIHRVDIFRHLPIVGLPMVGYVGVVRLLRLLH
mmetsp:Transcript_1739/g.4693  ORF Transcript_1739/g.4693 Transcript_1739/m.4693 type:complete len:380 (+) Transcript_1739:718-1857(+)